VVSHERQYSLVSGVGLCSPLLATASTRLAAGLEALAAYHEKREERLDSSHGSDAFGLMAIAYEEPAATRRFQIVYPRIGIA
jgi:hypothetical protein